jgi:SAM-dependent methyltransferase
MTIDINQLEWVEYPCVWCGSNDFNICFSGPDRLERLPGTFQLVQCKQCGLYRQNPRLAWNSLVNYYPDDYVAYVYKGKGDQKSWKGYIDNYGNVKRRKAIERYQPGGRLLEVGCGTGAFLNELIRSGKWDVVGIEPSKKAADHARQTTHIAIHEGRFNEINLDVGSFDAIVLWTVLEHLEQPIQDLRYACDLLKEKGWLFFSLPNVGCLETRIFHKYWAGWDLPRHLFNFPRSTLYPILDSVGFQIIDERCLASSYAGLGQSINFWSQQWEGRYPKLKRSIMHIYHSWLMRIGLLLPLTILDRLNLTSTITVFAQKR